MTINWYGQSCFKITTSGGLVIGMDPFDKSIGLNPPRFKADIVTVSHQHTDHNNVATLGEGNFVADTPGEFEIKGISIVGINSFHDNQNGGEKGRNTIFVIETEDLRVCHLGDLGQEILTQEQVESIGEVDILMVPVGGEFTVDGSQAATIVNQLGPKIVVPMHYKIAGLNMKLDGPEKFFKEMGADSSVKPVEKITVKKKDLVDDKTEVMLMSV